MTPSSKSTPHLPPGSARLELVNYILALRNRALCTDALHARGLFLCARSLKRRWRHVPAPLLPLLLLLLLASSCQVCLAGNAAENALKLGRRHLLLPRESSEVPPLGLATLALHALGLGELRRNASFCEVVLRCGGSRRSSGSRRSIVILAGLRLALEPADELRGEDHVEAALFIGDVRAVMVLLLVLLLVDIAVAVGLVLAGRLVLRNGAGTFRTAAIIVAAAG
mmetsp:Transcript_20982/g.41140  ORF Transcript_20982/g.41140 Transcript_20982/m.41140 type:complete len:225 (+) Transcript_20982:199-873(+)